MRLYPRKSDIPFSFPALRSSAFASLSLLISTAKSPMWVVMSDPWTLWRARSSLVRWWVSMWCLCRMSSLSAIGAVGSGKSKGEFSLPVFRVSEKQIQLVIGKQSTYIPPLIMAPRRRVQASIGMRSHLRNSLAKGAGR